MNNGSNKKQACMTTENHRAGTVSVTQNQITEEVHKCFAEKISEQVSVTQNQITEKVSVTQNQITDTVHKFQRTTVAKFFIIKRKYNLMRFKGTVSRDFYPLVYS